MQVSAASATCLSTVPEGTCARLTVLETTDLHTHVLGYDYYRLTEDPHSGFSRTATLISQARERWPNTVLLDNGDTIQGSVLADYQAQVEPVACDRELAIYQAMDAIGYDAGTIGNHEFNYGLAFLSQVTGTPMQVRGLPQRSCRGPDFPLVLSNVFSVQTGLPLFAPFKVLQRNVQAHTRDGQAIRVPIRIGLLGFTPPPIMQWDRHHLEGQVTVSGAVEAARRYLPALRKAGADVVLAMLHGGLDTSPYTQDMENPGWHLAAVEGIDAMLMGHQHSLFPGPRFAAMREVDTARGTVRGIPAVMGGCHGKHLGVLQLALIHRHGRWQADHAISNAQVIPISHGKNESVPAHAAIEPLVREAHRKTIAYVKTPIGHSDLRMSSYFADLGDVSALAIINTAQRDYVRQWVIQHHPSLGHTPVLSAAAAFRTGFEGADDYTDVPPGLLSIRNAADLYQYPNNVAAVHISGAQLKAWLEKSAERFNRINPAETAAQALVGNALPGYNFDQIQGDGLDYRIDVSRPVGQRIVALTLHGETVAPAQDIILASNSYRVSGGGHFPAMDGRHILYSSPDSSRQILIAWLRRHAGLRHGQLLPRSWRFAPLPLRGPVTYISAAGKLDLAHANGLDNVSLLRTHADGSASYAVDLRRT